jgi:FMN-binding domain
MKRILGWAGATATVVALLFGYHTSTAGALQAGSADSAFHGSLSSGTGSTAGTSGGAANGNGNSSGNASGNGSAGGSSSLSAPATKKTNGDVAQTPYGPLQVAITTSGSQVTDVSVLQYPNSNGTDQQINSYALPRLIDETLKAQSAQIDMVSGATYTSNGYLQSLQSALDRAGV